MVVQRGRLLSGALLTLLVHARLRRTSTTTSGPIAGDPESILAVQRASSYLCSHAFLNGLKVVVEHPPSQGLRDKICVSMHLTWHLYPCMHMYTLGTRHVTGLNLSRH